MINAFGILYWFFFFVRCGCCYFYGICYIFDVNFIEYVYSAMYYWLWNTTTTTRHKILCNNTSPRIFHHIRTRVYIRSNKALGKYRIRPISILVKFINSTYYYPVHTSYYCKKDTYTPHIHIYRTKIIPKIYLQIIFWFIDWMIALYSSIHISTQYFVYGKICCFSE